MTKESIEDKDFIINYKDQFSNSSKNKFSSDIKIPQSKQNFINQNSQFSRELNLEE